MPLIYAMVAYSRTVLAEYSPNTGNFTDIARQLVREIPLHSHKKSYAAKNMVFHYMAEDSGLIFMCMADADFGHRVPFMFLDDTRSKFLSQFGRTYQSAGEGSLNDTFSRTLSSQMNYYNTSPDADKARRVKEEIDSVKDIMIQNIDKVLERGDKIEVLVQETDRLQTQSYSFQTKSSQMKRSLWWKNVKLWLCIGGIFILIVAVILIIVLIYLGVVKNAF
jgi:vesicle-associated membrane protein 7